MSSLETVLAANLSPRVEDAIKKVLGADTDDFDQPRFDPADYINKHFGDERALERIDRTLHDMDAEIRGLDESILETVREQSTAGQVAARDISDAKDSIGDLAGKIREIKSKAEASESMVQAICRDIRQLDVAKRHLTSTIMTLARLKTLASAVEQLRGHSRERAYEEAAPLLEAAISLFSHFTDYRDVPTVSELATGVEKVREELREAVADDFDILINCVSPESLNFDDGGKAAPMQVLKLTDLDGGGDLSGAGGAGGSDEQTLKRQDLNDDQVATLQAAGEVVDALGPTVRRSIIKTVIRKQLKPYGMLFASGRDAGDSLDAVEKRYVWVRRALKETEAKYGRVLPPHWRVLHRMALDFCEATRTDIDRILGQYDPPSSAPAEQLLRALTKSLAFEREMSKRFEQGKGAQDATSSASAAAAAAAAADEDAGGEAERFNEAAPLYNDKGDIVDGGTAEGIKLKYRRKKEWEARMKSEAGRKAARDEKRTWLTSLTGAAATSGPPTAGANRRDAEFEDLAPFARPGEGRISLAFVPYMDAYVGFEIGKINAVIAQGASEDVQETTGSSAAMGGGPTATLLRSGSQLFAAARNAITRCAELNKGQTLFSLFKGLRDAFHSYAAMLEAKLPRPSPPGPNALPGDSYDLAEAAALAAMDSACLVASTAEYVAETVPQLNEAIKKLVEPSLKEHVVMEATQEAFFTLQANALKALAGVVTSLMDPALLKLSSAKWAAVAEVGDQSAYVSDVGRALRLSLPKIRGRLDESSFRNVCDKFARAFMPRYQSAIFRCKRVGEPGAQQLLLDAQAMRSLLLNAPGQKAFAAAAVAGGDEEDGDGGAGGAAGEDPLNAQLPPPPMYAKFILREMPRVEMLLKIVSSPKERFTDTIKALWPDASMSDLVRVMELKGLQKRDQQDVLTQLGLLKPGTGLGATIPLTMPSLAATGQATTAMGAKINERVAQAAGNMGKLFGAKKT